MDTVDARKTTEWFENLDRELAGRTPDYLVVSHLEPDHSSNIQLFAEKYPATKLVLSAKAKAMLPQFFDIAELDNRCVVVKEGETLELGAHKLQFFMAPMVHWPEVMVGYEATEKFSSLLMHLVNLVLFQLMKTGHVRQEDITLISLENTEHLFRLYLKKLQHLISRQSVHCMDQFLKKISILSG